MDFATTVLLTVLLGIGVVFVGLIVIIALISAMHAAIGEKKTADVAPSAPAVAEAPVAASAGIPNRQEFVAAVSAVLAEELGTEISAIRIHSIKKI